MDLGSSPDAVIMPQLTAGRYLQATAQLGSPFPHATMATLRKLPAQVVDQEMVNLFGKALTAAPDPSRSTAGMACLSISSAAGSTSVLHVSAGSSIVLQSSSVGDAYLSLGLLAAPTSQPLLHLVLVPSTPESVHVPDTGQPTDWLLGVQTNAIGVLKVCGQGAKQPGPGSTAYRAEAADGEMQSGWSPVTDASAVGGRTARLAAGTSVPAFTNDGFSKWFIPNPGLYDVWYRVRVSDSSGGLQEMTLGVWDGTAPGWVVKKAYASSQFGPSYSWVKVASGIFPPDQHFIRFQASFISQTEPTTVRTDWFIDEAALLPIGSTPPS